MSPTLRNSAVQKLQEGLARIHVTLAGGKGAAGRLLARLDVMVSLVGIRDGVRVACDVAREVPLLARRLEQRGEAGGLAPNRVVRAPGRVDAEGRVRAEDEQWPVSIHSVELLSAAPL